MPISFPFLLFLANLTRLSCFQCNACAICPRFSGHNHVLIVYNAKNPFMLLVFTAHFGYALYLLVLWHDDPQSFFSFFPFCYCFIFYFFNFFFSPLLCQSFISWIGLWWRSQFIIRYTPPLL
ncbi:hypothetical protein BDV25DRAFT_92543 [Aspergillus avenaceus]|uniref:Uncharacterized protein n=1 Tax=Aspergillus avenaceus TaxID=36643 RepID=A0A5N6TDP6_ASPAV|nr:hypothetical protein BDV25DRAFT_92543 [Aspergillus avenaceus]